MQLVATLVSVCLLLENTGWLLRKIQLHDKYSDATLLKDSLVDRLRIKSVSTRLFMSTVGGSIDCGCLKPHLRFFLLLTSSLSKIKERI